MKKNKFYVESIGMPLNSTQRNAFNKLNELIYLKKIKLEIVDECFCKSKEFEVLSRFDRYGLPFGTKICIKCGLISQTIKIKEEYMPLFYDTIYWHLIYGKEDNFQFSTQLDGVENFLPFILEEVNFSSKKIKILEIGVGEGNRINKLGDKLKEKYKLELYGSDFSKAALKNSELKGIRPIYGGLSECLEIGEVDILIMSHVFEHFVNLKQSLDLINKLVHYNSIIYVEVPGVNDLQNKIEYMYDYQDYSVLAHIHNFSLTTLSNVFLSKGFKLKKGNEYIRAIYSKSKKLPSLVEKNDYENIMKSLKLAKENNKIFSKKINNPIRKYFKILIKAFLGRL